MSAKKPSDGSDTKAGRVTAFALDGNVAAAAEGAHIPGIPGVWRHDVAVLPEAFGLTVGAMRDLVAELGLPLVEVRVADGKALDRLQPSPDHLPSEDVQQQRARGALGLADAIETGEPTEPEPGLAGIDATVDASRELEDTPESVRGTGLRTPEGEV